MRNADLQLPDVNIQGWTTCKSFLAYMIVLMGVHVTTCTGGSHVVGSYVQYMFWLVHRCRGYCFPLGWQVDIVNPTRMMIIIKNDFIQIIMYQGCLDEYIKDMGDITYVQDCFKQKGHFWVGS
jgi:hypothetical protein